MAVGVGPRVEILTERTNGIDAQTQWSPRLPVPCNLASNKHGFWPPKALAHIPAAFLLVSVSICVTLLFPGFLIYKVGIMIVLVSWNCSEGYLTGFMGNTQCKLTEITQQKFSLYSK